MRRHNTRWIGVSVLFGMACSVAPGWVAPGTGSPGAQTAPARSVELILDASGSMAGKLASGRVKIDAARSAVERFLGAAPASTRLSFRLYGHQSPRERHNCQDTELARPFGDATAARADIVARAKGVTPQGYTPITWVLRQAAKDFTAAETGQRFIVLVSDGKETCDGDPCATAKALALAKIVVHVIGFDVDETSRMQLKCIASVTGGTYFDAADAEKLAAAISQAATAPGKKIAATTGTGRLQMTHAELAGHAVIDAETGKQVEVLSTTRSTVSLPAGIYNVRMGPATWKGIEVRAGLLTLLDPGLLSVEGASLQGHDIVDSETGEVQGTVSASKDQAPLMPGTYDVVFGGVVWPAVRIEAGKPTALRPGAVEVKGADINGHQVKTRDGKLVGVVSATASHMRLPPGDYVVAIDGGARVFSVAAGQVVTIDRIVRR
jgi:hypothetical protein